MANSCISFTRYALVLQSEPYRRQVIDLFLEGHAPKEIATAIAPIFTHPISVKTLSTPVTWALRGNSNYGIEGLLGFTKYEEHLAQIVSAQKSRLAAKKVEERTHHFCNSEFGRAAAIKKYQFNQRA